MNEVARAALGKLLRKAEAAWGRDARETRLTLVFSEASFPEYVQLPSYAQRQQCNADLLLAEQANAIRIEWDLRAGDQRQVGRIELLDRDGLATYLGVAALWDQVGDARTGLAAHVEAFPAIDQVLAAWTAGRQVRGTRPTDWATWKDAAEVILACRAAQGADVPIRRLSARLFADSKRIESIWQAMDVLCQADARALAREDEEVYGELGLVKFPPTLLLAGDAVVELGTEVVHLARPYLGLPPRAVRGFSGVDSAGVLLTVENLTTFHELARLARPGDGRLLVYIGGMPSPSWLRVFGLLLDAVPVSADVRHWGDVDPGGFRIANHLASTVELHRRQLRLFGMDGSLHGGENTQAAGRRALTKQEIAGIDNICRQRGWTAEAAWVAASGLALEQESLPATFTGL